MALPSSGTITMGMIRTELKKTGAISLGSAECRKLAGKSSGAIKMSDFYGKSSYTHLFTIGNTSKDGTSFWGLSPVGIGKIEPPTFNGIKINVLVLTYSSKGGYSSAFMLDSYPYNTLEVEFPSNKFLFKLKIYNTSRAYEVTDLNGFKDFMKANVGKTLETTIRVVG